ncbi:phosphotransferase [Pseudoalteromonas sp. MTN2-4]|uniref:phosphotransferase n=1 Tax=Pseudoalteromonas sp. MTN2-4 TaxID=3056555 RepID=UPI0036F24804
MVYHLRAYSFKSLPVEVREFVAESLAFRQVKACYQITSGLSNHNYLIVVEQNKYLLKLYRNDMPSPSLAFQGLMAKSATSIQDVIRWDAALKVALFTYVDEAVEDIDKKRLCNLVETISAVHQQPLVNLPVSLDIKHALSDLSTSFKNFFNSELECCLRLLDSYPKELGCCHNDLVRENIIATKAGVVVIDFEYAAVGDVYFDLAGLVTSFKLTNVEIVWMLNIYYGTKAIAVPDYAIEKLMGYRIAYLLLCISWYDLRGEVEKATSHTLQLKRLNTT